MSHPVWYTRRTIMNNKEHKITERQFRLNYTVANGKTNDYLVDSPSSLFERDGKTVGFVAWSMKLDNTFRAHYRRFLWNGINSMEYQKLTG